MIIKVKRFELLLLLVIVIRCAQVNPSLNGHVLPLYGNNTLGYYYTYLYMGTPPQQQSVIVDTGSDKLAVPCSMCTDCSRNYLDPIFDIEASSTHKVKVCPGELQSRCLFLVEYEDGSTISGLQISDFMQFQPKSIGEGFQVPFGCTFTKTGVMSKAKVNGIWGLSPGWEDLSLLIHRFKHKKFTNETMVLSVCLSKNGGQMMIGKTNDELTKEIEPAHASFNVTSSYYSLNEVGVMRLGDNILRSKKSFPPSGIIIDSGSTFTYISTQEFQILKQKTNHFCTQHFDQCSLQTMQANWTCYQINLGFRETMQKVLPKIFPNIEIEIGGKVVSWPPERYFIIRKDFGDATCLGVKAKKDQFILGANWMVNRNIVFNHEKHTIQIYSDVSCSESNEGIAEGMIGGVDIKVSKEYVEIKIVAFILLYLMLGGRIYRICRRQRQQRQCNKGSSTFSQLQENVGHH